MDTEINVRDALGQTPLLVAVKENNFEAVKSLLLCSGIDVNAQDKDGKTPLLVAIRQRNSDIVKALLKSKAIDLHVRQKDGSTMLYEGIQCGLYKITKQLVLASHPSDFLSKDNCGLTPLECLLRREYDDMINIFLRKNKVEPTMDRPTAKVLLSSAMSCGRESVAIQILHMKGFWAYLSAQEAEGLLFKASMRGQVAIVKDLMLHHNINRHAIGDGNFNALQFASGGFCMPMIRLLLSFDLSPRGDQGLLQTVAQSGDYETFQQIWSYESYKDAILDPCLATCAIQGRNPDLIQFVLTMLPQVDHSVLLWHADKCNVVNMVQLLLGKLAEGDAEATAL